MVWVRNVFLNYENGGETSFLFMGWGRNVFPKYELGAKRLTKIWCELTMGRKVCVPPKIRSARMKTQQARVTDPYNIGPSMVEFLLFAGNSATGTVKAVFLQLFYFTAFRYLYNCM